MDCTSSGFVVKRNSRSFSTLSRGGGGRTRLRQAKKGAEMFGILPTNRLLKRKSWQNHSHDEEERAIANMYGELEFSVTLGPSTMAFAKHLGTLLAID